MESQDELKRGDVPKSIQCYMNETGASEEDAREYIRCMISATWNKMNECIATSSLLSQTFIEMTFNAPRMFYFMYHHGDGYGVGNHKIKDCILSLLVQSIPLKKNSCD